MEDDKFSFTALIKPSGSSKTVIIPPDFFKLSGKKLYDAIDVTLKYKKCKRKE